MTSWIHYQDAYQDEPEDSGGQSGEDEYLESPLPRTAVLSLSAPYVAAHH